MRVKEVIYGFLFIFLGFIMLILQILIMFFLLILVIVPRSEELRPKGPRPPIITCRIKYR